MFLRSARGDTIGDKQLAGVNQFSLKVANFIHLKVLSS
jgi:hypothetical protein